MQGGYFKKMQKNEMDEKVIQMRNLPFQVDGQVMVYTMPQEVDHHVAQTLCAELDQLISSYQIKELVLDFEKTGFMDSSGIGIMIGRHKMMQFYGGSVAVMNMGARVESMFRAAGLYRIVNVKEV